MENKDFAIRDKESGQILTYWDGNTMDRDTAEQRIGDDDRLEIVRLYASPSDALKEMHRKVQEGVALDQRGYVTYTPEIVAILGNLTDLVPWNVFPASRPNDPYYSYEFKVGFSVDIEDVEG